MIKPFFRWYDLWVGVYIDIKNKTVYICPFPMVGIKVCWLKEAQGMSEEHTAECRSRKDALSWEYEYKCDCGVEDRMEIAQFQSKNTALQKQFAEFERVIAKLVEEKRELEQKVDNDKWRTKQLEKGIQVHKQHNEELKERIKELEQKLAKAVETVAESILAVTAAYDQGWDEGVEATQAIRRLKKGKGV